MPTPPHTAHIRCYGPLNDFLPREHRQMDWPYRFWGQPAVKDAIEAIGVPHPEVFYLQRDGKPVGFDHSLADGERISVFPRLWTVQPETGPLRYPAPTPPRFVLDTHLGQLARYLRMLGLDTLYSNNADDPELARRSHTDERILLTRDLGLLKRNRVTHGAFVRATDPEQQLQEILRRFDLAPYFDPMTRCLTCNGDIEPVEMSDVADELPPRTRRAFNAFYRCAQCEQVYWKGSHFERMQQFIKQVTS